MTLLKEAFAEVNKKHNEATAENDIDALKEVAIGYETLLNDAPEDVSIIFGAGTAKMQTGFNGAAIVYFQQALQIKELPEIWNNLGTAFKAENHGEQAKQCWEQALKLRQDPDYYNNMTTLYVNEGKPAEGIEWAEKGLQINPEHGRMHWNYSLLLLESGKWKEGFDHYDFGLISNDRPNRQYSDNPDDVPYWQGEPGRVVVYGEQGMGDEIMFASCLPDLIEQQGQENIVFDCHPRMKALFERSFGVQCYGTRKSENIRWPTQEMLDYRIAIGSLFRVYRSEGVFPKTPYIVPDEDLVAEYRARLEATGPGPYVGIGWKAGVKRTRTDLRSMKLRRFNELIDLGGTFISLQYDEDAVRKTDQYKEDFGRTIHHWPEVVEAGAKGARHTGYDFDHTVALIQALDLCVLPNTTAVHVCGALGKECWTMTPDACAWRYQLQGDEMPMYASVRQFRGEDAMEQVIEAYGRRYSRPRTVSAGA